MDGETFVSLAIWERREEWECADFGMVMIVGFQERERSKVSVPPRKEAGRWVG